MATGAPATETLGVWDGSRRGSKSAADDEAAGDLLLKLQEGGAKVVAINRMADPVLRKRRPPAICTRGRGHRRRGLDHAERQVDHGPTP